MNGALLSIVVPIAFERPVMGKGMTRGLQGEWPSDIYSLRQVTEVKLGKRGLTSQLTSSSFGRDVKLGVPCQDATCTVGLN